MGYVNKVHKINFALDDNDIAIVMLLRKKYCCTIAELFRRLLRSANLEVLIALTDLQKEISEVRKDLIKLIRS